LNFCQCAYRVLQWTVYGRSGVNGGNVTSVAETEQVQEPDRVQTLHRHKVAPIVRGRHRKRQSVFWQIVQVLLELNVRPHFMSSRF